MSGYVDLIIVSGQIFVSPGKRDDFLLEARDAIIAARQAPGCRDFVVAGDPLEADRVNVYEEWDSAAELEAFRGAGPGPSLTAAIVSARVRRHQVSTSGPA